MNKDTALKLKLHLQHMIRECEDTIFLNDLGDCREIEISIDKKNRCHLLSIDPIYKDLMVWRQKSLKLIETTFECELQDLNELWESNES